MKIIDFLIGEALKNKTLYNDETSFRNGVGLGFYLAKGLSLHHWAKSKSLRELGDKLENLGEHEYEEPTEAEKMMSEMRKQVTK